MGWDRRRSASIDEARERVWGEKVVNILRRGDGSGNERTRNVADEARALLGGTLRYTTSDGCQVRRWSETTRFFERCHSITLLSSH